MLKKTLILTLVLTLVASSFVFADVNQSALSKATGLTDQQITELSKTYRGYGRILTASIVAKLINSNVEDVLKAHQNGATFFEIAQGKGVDLSNYQAALQNGKNAYIDEQVKAGTLTEEQAKIIKDRMAQQIENCDGLGNNNGFGGRGCNGAGGFGRNTGMGGFRMGGNGMRGLFNQ